MFRCFAFAVLAICGIAHGAARLNIEIELPRSEIERNQRIQGFRTVLERQGCRFFHSNRPSFTCPDISWGAALDIVMKRGNRAYMELVVQNVSDSQLEKIWRLLDAATVHLDRSYNRTWQFEPASRLLNVRNYLKEATATAFSDEMLNGGGAYWDVGRPTEFNNIQWLNFLIALHNSPIVTHVFLPVGRDEQYDFRPKQERLLGYLSQLQNNQEMILIERKVEIPVAWSDPTAASIQRQVIERLLQQAPRDKVSPLITWNNSTFDRSLRGQEARIELMTVFRRLEFGDTATGLAEGFLTQYFDSRRDLISMVDRFLSQPNLAEDKVDAMEALRGGDWMQNPRLSHHIRQLLTGHHEPFLVQQAWRILGESDWDNDAELESLILARAFGDVSDLKARQVAYNGHWYNSREFVAHALEHMTPPHAEGLRDTAWKAWQNPAAWEHPVASAMFFAWLRHHLTDLHNPRMQKEVLNRMMTFPWQTDPAFEPVREVLELQRQLTIPPKNPPPVRSLAWPIPVEKISRESLLPRRSRREDGCSAILIPFNPNRKKP